MNETIRPARTRLLGVAVGVLLSVTALAGAFAPSASAYTCPGDPSPIWGCPAYGAGKYDGIFNWKPGVTVIGDSLVQGLGSRLANQLTTSGFWGHTYGVAGSSFYHWNNMISGKDLGGWVAEYKPKHAVIALGTNDASKLGNDSRVTRAEVRDQIFWGMERAWQAVPGCVIVVGPSRHNSSPTNAQYVRDQMAYRIWTTHGSKPVNHRFAWFNWDEHSKNNPEWFNGPNDPHMTEAGKQAYSDALTFVSAVAELNGC